eukprot:Skav212040  [mRNA]  locus=scaffold782:86224:87860:+ [translate_table: standard]
MKRHAETVAEPPPKAAAEAMTKPSGPKNVDEQGWRGAEPPPKAAAEAMTKPSRAKDVDDDLSTADTEDVHARAEVPKFWNAFDAMVDIMFVMDLMIQFLFTYTSEKGNEACRGFLYWAVASFVLGLPPRAFVFNRLSAHNTKGIPQCAAVMDAACAAMTEELLSKGTREEFFMPMQPMLLPGCFA